MILAQRLLAVLVIVIPGILAGYGWTLMRDAIFADFSTNESFHLFSFLAGLALFGAGIAFIGGFFVYREKKKKEYLEQKSKNPKIE